MNKVQWGCYYGTQKSSSGIDPGDVRAGIAVDDTVGTLAVPIPGDVRAGSATDNTVGTLDVEAEANLPTTGQVLLGVSFGPGDAYTGRYGTVQEQNVRKGITFGLDNTSVGTVVLPAVTNVRDGVFYGDDSDIPVEFEGNLELPVTTNVVLGVSYGANGTEFNGVVREATVDKVELDYVYGPNDNRTGTSRLPLTGQVQDAVVYGPSDSLTGTLDVGGGGVIPAPADVRLGVSVGEGGTGLLNLPAVGNVRLGTSFDNGTKSGTLDLPTTANVRNGIKYDGNSKTGLLSLPTVDKVTLGTTYDAPTSQQVGTSRLPATSSVVLGTAFGPSDTLTGNVVLPAAAQVNLGISYGPGSATSGLNRNPPAGNVLLDYVYGPNDTLTGTLDPGAGGVVPSPNDVRQGVEVGATTGLLNLPSVNSVVLGVSFDQGAKTGTVRTAPTNKVEQGYVYGPNDTLTGTLVGGDPPVFPTPGNVRLGVTYGTVSQPSLYTGNVRVPPAEKVEYGYQYDALDAVTGTLVAAGNVDYPEVTNVLLGVSFDNGNKVGVYQPADVQYVVSGYAFGAYGAQFLGTFVCGNSDPGDVEWVG